MGALIRHSERSGAKRPTHPVILSEAGGAAVCEAEGSLISRQGDSSTPRLRRSAQNDIVGTVTLLAQNDKNAPEVRFAGFTDPWEQRKLGDIAEIVTGLTPPTADEDNYDGSYLFVTPGDIDGRRPIDSTATTLSEKGVSLSRRVRLGSSLFVCIGSTVGKVGQVECGVAFNQQINALTAKESISPDCLYTLLEALAPAVKESAAVQAVPIVNKSTFADVDAYAPHFEEQFAIGSFFSRLDSLITLTSRKLELLRNVRKSLLDKMFV